MKHGRAFVIGLCLLTGLACRLTSPTPASWSGTPTAQARAQTDAAIAETAEALFGRSPTKVTLPELPAGQNPTATPSPPIPADGPWLVFPGDQGALKAYDVEAKSTLEIRLPPPVIFTDLMPGRSPLGDKLVLRAGAPENLDELALYQVDLHTAEVTKISPLLSIALQRKIVNQQGTEAFDALAAVTRENGLSWSPNGRYLAFTAALDNASTDLYLYDAWQQNITRLNGLYTHNGFPVWSPNNNWLVSQEFGLRSSDQGWKSINVTVLQVPGYNEQHSLYLPPGASQAEVFLGWLNAQSFLSFSQTAGGAHTLREVNLETLAASTLFDHPFNGAAFDPESKFLALLLDQDNAAKSGRLSGVYGFQANSPNPQLIRVGDFDRLTWNPGGMFIASGSSGVVIFPPEGAGFFLPDEQHASLSPSGNWLVAWKHSPDQTAEARLYQAPENKPLQTLLAARVEAVVWQPDSSGLFILSEGGLFHLAFPGLQPEEVAAGLPDALPQVFIWIN